jgi:hypothetical protein
MHPVFLQPEHLCKAELLSFPSNGPAFGLQAVLRRSVQSGDVVCAPCCRLRLICVLQAYWWPICLRHGLLRIR